MKYLLPAMVVALAVLSASTFVGLAWLERHRSGQHPSQEPVPAPAQANPGLRIEALAASDHSRRLLDHVGYPTQPEAYHESYVRGHSGWYTSWVMEYITPESLVDRVKRDGMDFKADPDVPAEYRWRRTAYVNSGEDIGHLANFRNAAYSKKAALETFLLPNSMPQEPELNRGQWSRLEDHVRDVASKTGSRVWCFTGPVWLPDAHGKIQFETIGNPPIWKPTHCWKAFYAECGGDAWMEGYILPNVKAPPEFTECRVPIDELESEVALDLFSGLHDETEDSLEAKR